MIPLELDIPKTFPIFLLTDNHGLLTKIPRRAWDYGGTAIKIITFSINSPPTLPEER